MNFLQGAIDIHLHCTPDAIPRAMDLHQVIAEAKKYEMYGVLLKNHTTSTAGRSYALNSNQLKVYSSIALNPTVGGLNPCAVEAALREKINFVYFPTYGAKYHIDLWGRAKAPTNFPMPQDYPGDQILDSSGKLKNKAVEILKLVKEHDAVLASGHISPKESIVLFRKASEMGIQKMIATHVSEDITRMSISEQKELVSLGVMLEHSLFATTECCPGTISLETIMEQIYNIGVEHCIISSDFGQVPNGNPIQLFNKKLSELHALGMSKEEIFQLVSVNPKKLLAPHNS